MKNKILPLMALMTLALPSLSKAGDNTVTVDPRDVQVSIKKHILNNDIRVMIQGQEYLIDNNTGLWGYQVETVAKQIQATILTASTDHVDVTINLARLSGISQEDLPNKDQKGKYPDGTLLADGNYQDVSVAFTPTKPAQAPLAAPAQPTPQVQPAQGAAASGKKRLTGWGYTTPPLKNQQLKFCVTAYFASAPSARLCPGAAFNEFGQFAFASDFSLPGPDKAVGYKYELFTAESASPLSPASEDLFGDAASAAEQHANLKFVIATGESAGVESAGGTVKDVPARKQANAGRPSKGPAVSIW